MNKMSVADAAAYYGVSREAIHNRIRRGSLSSVLENGVKLVLVDKKKTPTPRAQASKTISGSNDKYYKLLEEHNAKLQAKVEKLEDETRTLRDQKERMLIDERIKIEQIYRDKDEQLKNILTSFKSQFELSAPDNQKKEELFDAEIEVEKEAEKVNVVSLKKYLKERRFSLKKERKIIEKFKKIAKKDDRIIVIGKKYYLDLDKYDYKDIFKKIK